jgi:hypothetical protein
VREEKSTISEKALVKANTDLDAERAKNNATHQEYLDKLCGHTAHAKHTLGLDKMLGEKKVLLDKKEQDLALHEAALMEAHARVLNLQDNHEELMELVGLRRRLGENEVECVAKVGQLAVLVGDISKVLVDLGMPPILRIPQDLGTVGDVPEAVVTILERPQEAHASSHGPWD